MAATPCQGEETLGDTAFGKIEAAQEHTGPIADRVRHDLAAGEFMGERRPDRCRVDLQQRRRQLDQVLTGSPQWPSSVAS